MADDDYMSDAFLAKTVRPGLVFSRITARKYDMQRKKIESDTETRKSPSLRAKEEERRNEGLSTEIGEGNKGFALLKKMGYLEGCGLGRDD
ncbi:G patch domain-containing protein 11-like [Corticium candelabrum]|uniref:G patch domain-containing protein 11-like n=1 Tax=Corticium candelabrum TaxID=121492 RepID=UPI002E268CF0|nr:G patch domain-containing protein 11-like [Corticium candelabrum]